MTLDRIEIDGKIITPLRDDKGKEYVLYIETRCRSCNAVTNYATTSKFVICCDECQSAIDVTIHGIING